MKRLFMFAAIYCLSAVLTVNADSARVSGTAVEAGVYDMLTVDVELPFVKGDPNERSVNKVDALITTPSGEKVPAPLFCLDNMRGKKSIWRLRFTPEESGIYRYKFRIRTEEVTEDTSYYNLNVKKGQKKGFLRRSENNPYYLVYASGEPFFGIGHNIAWVQNDSIALFDRYFMKLAENGGNLTRVWISSWSFPLEWGKVGVYDRDVARKIDELLDIAEKRGMYMILTLDTYGSLMDEEGAWKEDNWDTNPYNVDNGGPCKDPKDFFTDRKAIALYKNKLAYILARWGASPNILALELWNEYNAPREWVEEIASFIAANDPYGHFVTTSLGYPWGNAFNESEIWRLDGITMITSHLYAGANEEGEVPALNRIGRLTAAVYKKPFIISEFGMDASKDDKALDPSGTGTALHNSLWCSAMSGSFGTAMNWWWDSYIRPQNLYGHYKALALFLSGVNWDSSVVEYPEVSALSCSGQEAADPVYRYARITPEDKWGKADTGKIVVSRDGDVSSFSRPNKYLHGTTKPDMKTDHVFYVDYPVDGNFIVKVGTVSQGAHLRAYVDGEEVKDRVFPAGQGEGAWGKSLYIKKYDVYQCIYNEDFKINVPAGKHVIKLTNAGQDWLGIEKITLTNYMNANLSKARVLGLTVGAETLFWIQDIDFNSHNASAMKGPEPIEKGFFTVSGVKDGVYSLEWWDTFEGKVVSSTREIAKNGELKVNVPVFCRDIACKMVMIRK